MNNGSAEMLAYALVFLTMINILVSVAVLTAVSGGEMVEIYRPIAVLAGLALACVGVASYANVRDAWAGIADSNEVANYRLDYHGSTSPEATG